jgi:hypothetical protein
MEIDRNGQRPGIAVLPVTVAGMVIVSNPQFANSAESMRGSSART